MTIRKLVNMMNTTSNVWITVLAYNGLYELYSGHYFDADDDIVSEDVLEFSIDSIDMENSDWGVEVDEITITTFREV